MKFIEVSNHDNGEEIIINIDHIIMISPIAVEIKNNDGSFREYLHLTEINLVKPILKIIVTEDIDYIKKLIGQKNFCQ